MTIKRKQCLPVKGRVFGDIRFDVQGGKILRSGHFEKLHFD